MADKPLYEHDTNDMCSYKSFPKFYGMLSMAHTHVTVNNSLLKSIFISMSICVDNTNASTISSYFENAIQPLITILHEETFHSYAKCLMMFSFLEN